jgi:hypothetical protein
LKLPELLKVPKLPASAELIAQTLDNVIVEAKRDEDATFAALVIAAGLDPAHDFVGASLVNLDLRGEDLRGFNFSGADLTGTDFRGANLEGLSLDDAILVGAIGLANHGQEGTMPDGLLNFLVNFSNITAFAEVIQYDFQPLQNLLTELETVFKETASRRGEWHNFPEPNLGRFHRIWHHYDIKFRQVNRDIFDNKRHPLTERLELVDKSFENLQSIASRTGLAQNGFAISSNFARDSFSRSSLIFSYIREGLREFPVRHHSLLESQRDGLDNAFRDFRAAAEIWVEISRLARIAQTLVFQAHALVSNMLGVLHEGVRNPLPR